ALCANWAAVILTARVQQAEAGAGGGSPVVLVAERLAPYKTAERGPELDVTPVQRRERATGPPRKGKDPTEVSRTGERYFRAARPPPVPEPPPHLPEPPIEAYDEAPLPNGDYTAPPAAPVSSSTGSTQYAIGNLRIILPSLGDEAADEERM